MRIFENAPANTAFTRIHMDGVIAGWRPKGKGQKWSVSVTYRGKVLGEGEFSRIRDAESWAIGLLRKARKTV